MITIPFIVPPVATPLQVPEVAWRGSKRCLKSPPNAVVAQSIPMARVLVIDDSTAIDEDYRKILGPPVVPRSDLLGANAFFDDDEPEVKPTEYEITQTLQGEEGLAAVEEAVRTARPFSVAFVDGRMPRGWDGVETISRLWKVDPDLQVVLCTACSDYSFEQVTARLGLSDRLVILKKPFDVIEVRQLTHVLAEKRNLLQRLRHHTTYLENTVKSRTQELVRTEAQLLADITERKQAAAELTRTAEALRQSGRFLQSTLDALSAHIAILDEHGTIIGVNAAWNCFGSENNFKGSGRGTGLNYLKVCDSVSGRSAKGAAKVAGGIRAVMAGESAEFHMEYPCHSPQEKRWFVVRATRFGGEGPVRVVVAHENITGRKLAEELQQRQQTELRVLFDLMPALIWFKDTKNRFLRVNQRAADAAGKSVAEMDGRPGTELYPETAAKFYADDLEVIHSRAPKLGIIETIQAANGQESWIQTDKVPVCDQDGKVIGIVVMAQDITERKKAQAEMENLERKVAEHKEIEERSRRALEHEQELQKTKSRFVSIVSHEFRTPLGVINTAAHLLGRYAERISGPERSGQIGEIHSAVERMTQMMEDLLVHGNFQAGKMECKPARVDVELLCQGLISELSNLSGASQKIECTVAPNAREAFLDGKILRHILGNLLNNAIKYSQAGPPVTLEVKRVAGDAPAAGGTQRPPGDCLQVKVGDSGIGIPAADMARLFETFHRAANVGNRPGTGMGLAIVKQYVDLHGGTIRFESTEGKGTTVWVELPIVSSETTKGNQNE
jgi:PAS domain S-box-containing protein